MVALLRESLPLSMLITDDDESWRAAFNSAFAHHGYDTYLAACGTDALRIVRNQEVHVAILDMHMPDMSGVDTLVEIRRETGHVVPAILVSSDRSTDLQIKALAAHFMAYMSKPVDMDLLRRVVSRIVFRRYPGGRTEPSPQTL